MQLLFDHGTLVLAEPPDINLDFVPGLLWDPRVALWRAPAFRYADVVAALGARGLSFVNKVKGGPNRPTRWNTVPLRPYQQAAQLAWELNASTGVVVLPTGAGKTRLAIAAMAGLGQSTLCLVPTRALLHQWRGELAKFYAGPVGCLGDGTHDIQLLTVATFESALRHMPRLGHRFELLIVDEVHHFGSGVKDEALEMSAARYRLGLTATPPDDAALERIEQLVGAVVYSMSVADLAGKWLSEFDQILLRLTLNAEERSRYDNDYRQFREVHRRFRKLHPGGTWQEFVAAAAQSPEGRAALLAWHRSRRLLEYTEAKAHAVQELLAQHRDSRVLVFTAGNDAAYAIARQHLIMPITCDIGRREREQALTDFRSGELRALVSSRVLNEGIDVPDADVAIIVGGTFGEREHVQRVGRLLRPSVGKRASVYELVTLGTAEARQAMQRRRGLAAASSLSA